MPVTTTWTASCDCCQKFTRTIGDRPYDADGTLWNLCAECRDGFSAAIDNYVGERRRERKEPTDGQ